MVIISSKFSWRYGKIVSPGVFTAVPSAIVLTPFNVTGCPAFKKKYPHAVFAIGEGCNANAFELAFALIRYEFAVAEVFGNLSKEDFVYIEKMAKLSPETKIYSNLEPTMIYYEPGENPVDIVIGKDAVYYHPEAAQLEWSDDIQPFGYRGVKHFFEECERVLELERGTN